MFVETKRDGEAPVKQEPSLRGFVAWLEKQDSTREYDWTCGCHCAVAEYAMSLDSQPFTGHHLDFCLRRKHPDSYIWKQLDRVAHMPPWTFGALLDRARNALSEC